MALRTSLTVAGDASGATAALAATEAALDNATAASKRLSAANDQAAASNTRVAVSAGQARAGYQNLGRQAQDVAVQLSGGQSIGTILAQQGPQVADALAQMGGRFSRFASFLAGPYGAAIFLATSAVLNLVPALLSASDASKEAEKASEDLAKRLGDMATFFDLATGAINRQNVALIANARLKRLDEIDSAEKQQKARRDQIGKIVKSSGSGSYVSLGSSFSPGGEVFTGDREIINAINGAKGNQKAISDALLGIVQRKGTNARTARQVLDLRGQVFSTDADLARLKLEDDSLRTGKLAAELAKPKGGGGGRTGRASGSGSSKAGKIESFVDGAENRIAALTDQFNDLPPAIVRSNSAMRDLNKIAGELKAKSPPDFARLEPAIKAAGDAIQASLNKPFNDYLEAQRESATLDQLLIAGRDDEAEALKRVLALQKQQGPLSQDQLDTVLATVVGERQRNQVLRDQGALIQANVGAVQDLRGTLENTVGDLLRGKFSVQNVLASVGNSFLNITSKRIVESMFGSTLRALEDQATGADKVQVASTAIATALDGGKQAVGDFTTALVASVRKITGAAATPAASTGSNIDPATGEYIDPVTGERSIRAVGRKDGASAGILGSTDTGNFLTSLIAAPLRLLGIQKLPTIFTDGIRLLSTRLEQVIPNAIGGALTGSAASKLILGAGGSSLGGAIGGALGGKLGEQFLSKGLSSISKSLGSLAGPIGSVLGGLAGGLIGKLFGGTKYGSAAISNGNVSTAGNKGEFTSGAASAAGQVNSAIQKIAQALGGSVGDYAVSIGLTNGNFNVNPGLVNGKIGTKFQKDTVDFKKDEAGALAFAIANAVSDGAIKGISAQVAKALQSSPDIDKALAEATKVQGVESLLGGMPYQLKKALGDFENQARERLRIATQYGFDVVALEKRNADDRLKLTQKLVADQVGSLQSLLDDITSGSLFEGSAVDQRNAILGQITTARADAAAGTEGAADKLARLLEQLNAVSRDAFGTTGGFAADRATIVDVSRDAIAQANQRVAEAQAATDPALAATNAALDENNDQNAQMIAALGITNAQLQALVAQGGVSGLSGLAALARTS